MQGIYIYGTGDYGHRLHSFLKDYTDINVAGFIKTKVEVGEKCEGLDVIGIDRVSAIGAENMVLIAIADKKTVSNIRVKLITAGISGKKILDCSGFITNNLSIDSKKCPICGSIIKDYLPEQFVESELFQKHHIIGAGYRKNMKCPVCGCIDRIRWLLFVLATQTDIFDGEHSILHFAPESPIRERLQNGYNQYIPADINPTDGRIKVDIREIPFKDGTFDYVIANHVLEHIDDLGKALSELKRVIKPEGKIILSFPICMDMKTIEEEKPLDEKERLRRFGQEDHVRLFGNDYGEIIGKQGLSIKCLSPNRCLSKDEIEDNGLTEDDVILICGK